VNVLSTAREPVQGALIITLQGKDVVLPGDLALRKAVQAAYRLDHLPAQQEVLAIADKWWPYRGLATSYLFSDGFDPAGLPDLHAAVDHEIDARHAGALAGREEQRDVRGLFWPAEPAQQCPAEHLAGLLGVF
jgi:hypothetical protein